MASRAEGVGLVTMRSQRTPDDLSVTGERDMACSRSYLLLPIWMLLTLGIAGLSINRTAPDHEVEEEAHPHWHYALQHEAEDGTGLPGGEQTHLY